MFDVAFSVEGPWELPEQVPLAYLILGLQRRIAELQSSFHSNQMDDVIGAFGFCDSYIVENHELEI